jgi:hypothetical protein
MKRTQLNKINIINFINRYIEKLQAENNTYV